MPPIKLKCATPKKRKKKKSLPSLCRQSSRRFENRSPLHLTSQLRDFVLNLLSQFALGGHSTTTWTKFYQIMTPSPLKWTIVVIFNLHDTFPLSHDPVWTFHWPIGWFKNPVSSQTEKLMAATKFSDYLQSCAKELEWSLFQNSEETIHSAEKMIPHIKGLDFSQRWSKKKNSKWPT